MRKLNIPKGTKVKVNLIKMGIVSKQPKFTKGPIVNRPARDTRAGSQKP
jgi:hypothetical protein